MQALKQSIEKAKPKQKAGSAQRKRKTATSISVTAPLVTQISAQFTSSEEWSGAPTAVAKRAVGRALKGKPGYEFSLPSAGQRRELSMILILNLASRTMVISDPCCGGIACC